MRLHLPSLPCYDAHSSAYPQPRRREDEVNSGMLQIGLKVAEMSVMAPVQRATVLAPEQLADKPQVGFASENEA